MAQNILALTWIDGVPQDPTLRAFVDAERDIANMQITMWRRRLGRRRLVDPDGGPA